LGITFFLLLYFLKSVNIRKIRSLKNANFQLGNEVLKNPPHVFFGLLFFVVEKSANIRKDNSRALFWITSDFKLVGKSLDDVQVREF